MNEENVKYFLTYGDSDEKEVNREEWILAERTAGFYPKMDPNHPDYYNVTATSSFSSGGVWGCEVKGRIETNNKAEFEKLYLCNFHEET